MAVIAVHSSWGWVNSMEFQMALLTYKHEMVHQVDRGVDVPVHLVELVSHLEFVGHSISGQQM